MTLRLGLMDLSCHFSILTNSHSCFAPSIPVIFIANIPGVVLPQGPLLLLCPLPEMLLSQTLYSFLISFKFPPKKTAP